MKKTTLSALKAGAAPAVLGLALISTSAMAQDKPADEKSDEAVIVVTGSLIQNQNIVSSSPVSAIGSNEIALRQVTLAEDVVRQIPGAVPNIGQNVNNGNNGASYVDLRGLGSNRNVVLLDGQRLVPSERRGRVDLNNIPLALIQRVDALTGGASTTYGADAVSGVVNFVTKKNFSGVELDAGYGINQQHSDGKAYHVDLTVGGNFADDRGNAVLSIGYQRSDPVYQGDRDISIFGITSTVKNNGVASGSSFTSVPTTFSFGSGDFQVNSGGTALVAQYQGFNFNPYNVFVVPVKRYNIYAAARYEISDAAEVYTRGMFSRNSVSTIIAPSGIFGENLTIPGNNPFMTSNPGIRDQLCTINGIALGASCTGNAAIPLGAVYRRSVELGPRVSTYTTQFFDYNFGVRGNIASNIKYDVYGAYGESENTEVKTGYVSKTRVQDALNNCASGTSGCVPLNLFGGLGAITPAMGAYIGGITSAIARKASLGQIHGQVSGEFNNFSGSSKPISVAVGGEYRKYTAGVEPDNLAQVPGELGGAGGATLPVHGGYTVRELFAELSMPIAEDKPGIHELSLDAGIRGSWYKVDAAGNPSFGTTTWKAGLNYAPVPELKLRANYQRAVRAPNIGELFDPSVVGLTNLAIDPCSTAAANLYNTGTSTYTALGAVCLAQGAPAASVQGGLIQNPSAGQANEYGGGNPLIKPETASSWGLGVVITPTNLIPDFSMTVDYYNIIVNNAITTAVPGDVIDACFKNITASSATSPACTSIRRSGTNGRLSGSSATVPGLPLPLTNNGRLATDGIDFTVNWKHAWGDWKLAMSLAGNWTDHSRFQASSTSLNRDCVGYYSANCASIQPKWSWFQRTTVTYKMVDMSLQWRHLSGEIYEPGLPALYSGPITNGSGASSPLAGTTQNFNKIPAYDYFDLSTRVTLGDHFEITGTISNLFNRKPPVVGSTAGSTSYNSGNTYPSTYDAVGRRYMISGKVKF